MNNPFVYVRPERPEQIPAQDRTHIDIHVLDMNHTRHNAGHDSIVELIRRLAIDLAPVLETISSSVRLISYDVRHRLHVPAPTDRTALYIGTGGPGHLDPRQNRTDSPDHSEISESAAWERPLFALFDAIAADEQAMLYGVCHTFGLLCRWSGIARAFKRGEGKGGKSTGIVDNVLTPEALRHPWFSRLASHLPDGVHLPVVDSRNYDLIPSGAFPQNVTPIGYECPVRGGEAGEALTMVEFARKANGVPRIFATNHHPEIPEASELSSLLSRKLTDGQVTRQWYESRAELLPQLLRDDHSEPARLLAAGYSFGFLVRDGLHDLIRARRERHGRAISKAL